MCYIKMPSLHWLVFTKWEEPEMRETHLNHLQDGGLVVQPAVLCSRHRVPVLLIASLIVVGLTHEDQALNGD